MERDVADVRRDLAHVYWIGGSSRGGKSTMADALEREFGFHVYRHDEKWLGGDHARAADPERHPAMVRYWNEYMNKDTAGRPRVEWICETYPVDQLVQDQIDFFTEQFEMVVDDLYALPADNPVVAEGSGLLPDCVSRVADRQKGIWMVSTQGFEQEMRPFVGQKSEPWFEKLTEWSAKRREHTVTRAEQLGLKIVETDGSRTTADTIELVKTHFGLR